MRYSRMLEESSFANKRADYFWLLLQSAIMLLVSTVFQRSNHPDVLSSVSFSSFQSSFSFLSARFRSYLCVVKTPSFNTNFFVWPNKYHSTLPALRTYCVYMAPDWHMEIGSRRSGWMCCWPHWVVLARRMDKGDGGWDDCVK